MYTVYNKTKTIVKYASNEAEATIMVNQLTRVYDEQFIMERIVDKWELNYYR